MGLFGRKHAKVATPSPRMATDPALENRDVSDRLPPHLVEGYLGDELACDYVPMTVRGARYYITRVARPTNEHLVDVVADDVSGESRSLSNVNIEDLPAEIYNSFFPVGWFQHEIVED